MLNFAICDDNKHMLNRLSSLLESAFIKGGFEGNICLKTTNYEELINYITYNKVDVIFLDIQFNNTNLNGLDISKKIRELDKNCYIIFSTSHIEYVMQAYKSKTFDYLIKNSLTIDPVLETLTRLFDDIKDNSNNFLQIDTKGTIIDLNDIQFIEKDLMKLIYHTSCENYITYNSFTNIQNVLPTNFIRCHKSYIANICNISNVKLSENKITFKNNSICYIGPKYKDSFLEVFKHDTIFE